MTQSLALVLVFHVTICTLLAMQYH